MGALLTTEDSQLTTRSWARRDSSRRRASPRSGRSSTRDLLPRSRTRGCPRAPSGECVDDFGHFAIVATRGHSHGLAPSYGTNPLT